MNDTRQGAKTVLVVEDDEALRTLFEVLLSRRGYEVECVADGEEALRRLEIKTYSVMLLDLLMPEKDGFDVLRQLSGTKRRPLLRKTIITTGVADRELARIDQSSVFAVLRKPFDIDRLMTTVNRCARQRTPRAREPKPGRSAVEDDGESRIDGSARRFEAALPALSDLLSSATSNETELLLLSELRRTMGEAARVLATTAIECNDARGEWRMQVANRAAEIAVEKSKHQH